LIATDCYKNVLVRHECSAYYSVLRIPIESLIIVEYESLITSPIVLELL